MLHPNCQFSLGEQERPGLFVMGKLRLASGRWSPAWTEGPFVLVWEQETREGPSPLTGPPAAPPPASPQLTD